MTIVRHRRARWGWWRIIIAICAVLAAASVTAFIADPPPTWALIATVVVALVWLISHVAAKTLTINSMRQLAAHQARRFARAEHDRPRSHEDFPIDVDAIVDFCQSMNVVLLTVDGGRCGTDQFISPSLAGYVLPGRANDVADAAAATSARILLLDSNEAVPADVLADFGFTPDACFPPEVTHIAVDDDVTLSAHLVTAIRHSVMVVIATDRCDSSSAYTAWGELAAAARRETAR